MKDLHAHTHGFLISVDGAFEFEALPIDEFCAKYRVDFSKPQQRLTDAIVSCWDEDNNLIDAPIWYMTNDLSDALLALFRAVDVERLDCCDANDAALLFTQAFYGFEVTK